MKILSAIGIAGGLAALVAILITGDTFGYPGSERYRIYETFNRAMGFFLLLQVCSLIAFLMAYGGRLGWAGKLGLYAAILGWLGMAAGTAAEFWLYSDLSYGEQNMRQVAFSVFSLSSLLAGIAMLVLGIALFRSRILPRILSIAMIAYLLLDIALFFTGLSIFLAQAVYSIIIAVVALPAFARGIPSHKQPATIEE